jgi:hypothetical protein
MTSRTVFKLKVNKSESTCYFELIWGQGQTISVNLNYPHSLNICYEQWQTAYLNYYRQLRGRAPISGQGRIPADPRQVVDAETQLLSEFHRWLLNPELVSIRREIANAARQFSELDHHWVEVFLTCTPIELARLPWETWEIGTDLGTPEKIRISRTPANILNQPVHPIRRKARILAILGDNTGLNLKADEEEMRSLSSLAEVEFVRKDNFDITELKNKICHAIADERGWDVLFFAGHSNETILNDGELGIAPGVSLSIRQIEESIKLAKQRGLQFAIFNSCSGINIAESLIRLGLNQVVVMREPIHNKVAQEFLKQLIKSLAKYKDVHSALLDACHYLKQQEKRFNYPSAYLVPSLFRHPDTELFRIQPFGFWSTLKRWLPTKKEASWLVVFLLISLVPPVQNLLLEPRILLQAIYRQITLQVPSPVKDKLFLVKIDNQSLITDKVQERYPIDRSYLAKLIQHLSQLNSKLIGIDYIIDQDALNQNKQPPENTQQLKQAIIDAVSKTGTWFVFAYQKDENPNEGTISPEIASLNWSMQGDINFLDWYIELPPQKTDCSKSSNNCPFAYLLSLAYSLQDEDLNSISLPKPNLQSQSKFRSTVIKSIKLQNKQTVYLHKTRLLPITEFTDWFHPIIDFSIPPDRAYNSISACELLGSCSHNKNIPNNLEKYVVVIIPGGYKEAGIEEGEDNVTIPLAIAFWSGWRNDQFPRGEAHAYMIHHLLTRHLVVPIPDFLMILLAALLGKGMTLILLKNPKQRRRLMMRMWVLLGVYIIASLQIYISITVLLPWFLPSLTLWNYVRLGLRKKSYGES